MKLLFVMILVRVRTINCEGATNKRETIDSAKMKKELEDQKASLEKHETALEKQSKTNTNFRNKMEKEKVVNVELRKADAEKRQRDVAEITRNYIASEVHNYLVNSAGRAQKDRDDGPNLRHTESGSENGGKSQQAIQRVGQKR